MSIICILLKLIIHAELVDVYFAKMKDLCCHTKSTVLLLPELPNASSAYGIALQLLKEVICYFVGVQGRDFKGVWKLRRISKFPTKKLQKLYIFNLICLCPFGVIVCNMPLISLIEFL